MERVKRGGSAVNRSECGNDLPSNFSRSFFQLSLNYVYLGSFRRGRGGGGWVVEKSNSKKAFGI